MELIPTLVIVVLFGFSVVFILWAIKVIEVTRVLDEKTIEEIISKTKKAKQERIARQKMLIGLRAGINPHFLPYHLPETAPKDQEIKPTNSR